MRLTHFELAFGLKPEKQTDQFFFPYDSVNTVSGLVQQSSGIYAKEVTQSLVVTPL